MKREKLTNFQKRAKYYEKFILSIKRDRGFFRF